MKVFEFFKKIKDKEVIRYISNYGEYYSLRLYVNKKSSLKGTMDNKEILIGDIQVIKPNKGFGTIMMNELLKIAKEYNVKKIRGNISEVDWDHIERLKHFYKKFGFEISLNEAEKKGTIELILPLDT